MNYFEIKHYHEIFTSDVVMPSIHQPSHQPLSNSSAEPEGCLGTEQNRHKNHLVFDKDPPLSFVCIHWI